MPFIAMNFGGFLLVLGILAFASPGLFGGHDPNVKSYTSLIPAGIGLLIEICGALSLSKPGLRKHLMHVAAMIGVIGFVGGFMPVYRGGFDLGKASVIVGLIMSALCFVFVALCVRSFIAARKARKAAAAAA
jgi:hypothetical protein